MPSSAFYIVSVILLLIRNVIEAAPQTNDRLLMALNSARSLIGAKDMNYVTSNEAVLAQARNWTSLCKQPSPLLTSKDKTIAGYWIFRPQSLPESRVVSDLLSMISAYQGFYNDDTGKCSEFINCDYYKALSYAYYENAAMYFDNAACGGQSTITVVAFSTKPPNFQGRPYNVRSDCSAGRIFNKTNRLCVKRQPYAIVTDKPETPKPTNTKTPKPTNTDTPKPKDPISGSPNTHSVPSVTLWLCTAVSLLFLYRSGGSVTG